MTEPEAGRAGEYGRGAELIARIRGHHLILGVLAAVGVAAALIVGLGRVAGYARLGDAFSEADVPWLGVCVAGQAAVFTGYAGSLRAAIGAEDGPQIAAGPSLKLVFASFAATQLLAFGGVGGLAIIYWALRRVGMQRTQAAVRLIGLNAAVYLTFGIIGWAGALWALLAADAPLGLTLPWLVLMPVVLAIARWFTAPVRVKRWDPDRERGWRRALATGVSAAGWVRRRVSAPDGRALFGWSACYWVGDIASLWAALHAVGADPGLPALVLAYATGYLAQSLPIPFIATGGVDAATTFLLQMLGVPLELALAGVITHRVFAFWLPVLPGSVFALTLPRLGRTLSERAERSTSAGAPSASRVP